MESYHNILGIMVSFIYVFGIIFLARFLERYGKEASLQGCPYSGVQLVAVGDDFLTVPSGRLWYRLAFVVLNYLSYRFQLFSSMEREPEKAIWAPFIMPFRCCC